MTDKVLVTIEMRFTTDEDPDALGERIREATSHDRRTAGAGGLPRPRAAARPTEGSAPSLMRRLMRRV